MWSWRYLWARGRGEVKKTPANRSQKNPCILSTELNNIHTIFKRIILHMEMSNSVYWTFYYQNLHKSELSIDTVAFFLLNSTIVRNEYSHCFTSSRYSSIHLFSDIQFKLYCILYSAFVSTYIHSNCISLHHPQQSLQRYHHSVQPLYYTVTSNPFQLK